MLMIYPVWSASAHALAQSRQISRRGTRTIVCFLKYLETLHEDPLTKETNGDGQLEGLGFPLVISAGTLALLNCQILTPLLLISVA